MLDNKQRSLNRAVITGHLRHHKLHVTGSGRKLCSYTLVVVENSRNGTRQIFVDVVSWGTQAERIAALPEDAKVYVSGKLQVNTWTDKAGVKKHKLQILAETAEEVPSLNSRPATPSPAERPISDEDIPF
jgi:single-stranded DNA-binding protein